MKIRQLAGALLVGVIALLVGPPTFETSVAIEPGSGVEVIETVWSWDFAASAFSCSGFGGGGSPDGGTGGGFGDGSGGGGGGGDGDDPDEGDPPAIVFHPDGTVTCDNCGTRQGGKFDANFTSSGTR